MSELIKKQFTSVDVTKKKAKQLGESLAANIIEEGFLDPHKSLAQLARLAEVTKSAMEVLKNHVIDQKINIDNVEFVPNNGRKMPNYEEDSVYVSLEKKLSERKKLLDLAMYAEDPIFDSDGVQVPKISLSYSKSSLTIKF